MQFKWKLINQTWEMAKNLISDPILTQIWPPIFLDFTSTRCYLRYSCKLSSNSISRKMYDSNSKKWQKTSCWVWLKPIAPNFGPPIFFFYKSSGWTLIQAIILWNVEWKNDKKTNFGPNFSPFGLNLGPKTFFWAFYLYYVLEIVASYR